MPDSPRRVLTDWTTSAGLDGTGLLALVVGGRDAEGIHLATLGYETFVLHPDEAAVESAEPAAHVHHVAVDPAALPGEWDERFGLVVAMDTDPPWDVAAPQGLVVQVTDETSRAPDGFTLVDSVTGDDPQSPGTAITRTVFVRR